jgi:hypothetical protein
MSSPFSVEKTRKFIDRESAWAFMRDCDTTNGAIVAGYPTRLDGGTYEVRYLVKKEP